MKDLIPILFLLIAFDSYAQEKTYICGTTGTKYHLNINCLGLKSCGAGNSKSKVISLNYFPKERSAICKYDADKPGSCLSNFDSINIKNINNDLKSQSNLRFRIIIIIFLSILSLTVLYLIYKQANKTKQYEGKLNKLIKKTEGFTSLVNELKNEKIKFRELKNEAHHQFLIDSILKAKENIIIATGWITDSVVDDDFYKLISKKIEMGTSILIVYGYKFRGTHKNSNENTLNLLRSLSLKSSGKLVLKQGKNDIGNHSKCLIIDKEIIAIGSYNWLSTGKKTRNADSSVIIYDNEFASKEADYFYRF